MAYITFPLDSASQNAQPKLINCHIYLPFDSSQKAFQLVFPFDPHNTSKTHNFEFLEYNIQFWMTECVNDYTNRSPSTDVKQTHRGYMACPGSLKTQGQARTVAQPSELKSPQKVACAFHLSALPSPSRLTCFLWHCPLKCNFFFHKRKTITLA